MQKKITTARAKWDGDNREINKMSVKKYISEQRTKRKSRKEHQQ